MVDWLVKRAKETFSNNQSQEGVSGQNSVLRREDVVAYILSPSMDLRDAVRGGSLMKEDKREERRAKENLEKNLIGRHPSHG